MMAADTLGSYGSLSRFHNMNRVIDIGNHTMLGAGGEMSDFQKVTQYLQQLELSHIIVFSLYFSSDELSAFW